VIDILVVAGVAVCGGAVAVGGAVYTTVMRSRRVDALRGALRPHGGTVLWAGGGNRPRITLPASTGTVVVRPLEDEGGVLQARTSVPRMLPFYELDPELEAWITDGSWRSAGTVRPAHTELDRRLLTRLVCGTLETARQRLGATSLRLSIRPSEGRAQSWVVLRADGDELAPERLLAMAELTARVSEDLVAAWAAPWAELAARYGAGPPGVDPQGYRMVDLAHGPLRVAVREGERRGRVETSVHVALALPVGLRVLHRDLARAEGWLTVAQPTGNPVLDMLVAMRCGEPGQAAALLADDEVTGALLEVVHAFPGSELNQHGVSLCAREAGAIDPAPYVEAAITLAQLLQRALDPGRPSA